MDAYRGFVFVQAEVQADIISRGTAEDTIEISDADDLVGRKQVLSSAGGRLGSILHRQHSPFISA